MAAVKAAASQTSVATLPLPGAGASDAAVGVGSGGGHQLCRVEVKDARPVANLEVSYLLEKVGQYRGAMVVATSAKPEFGLGTAFRFVVRLPRGPWP